MCRQVLYESYKLVSLRCMQLDYAKVTDSRLLFFVVLKEGGRLPGFDDVKVHC